MEEDTEEQVAEDGVVAVEEDKGEISVADEADAVVLQDEPEEAVEGEENAIAEAEAIGTSPDGSAMEEDANEADAIAPLEEPSEETGAEKAIAEADAIGPSPDRSAMEEDANEADTISENSASPEEPSKRNDAEEAAAIEAGVVGEDAALYGQSTEGGSIEKANVTAGDRAEATDGSSVEDSKLQKTTPEDITRKKKHYWK
jgi:hypothetical protein